MGEFVIASGDAAEVFHATEQTFNEIAVLVLMHIVFTGRVAVGARRDDRLGPGVGDRVQQGVGIEGFVGDHSIGIDALQQGIGLRDVMRLPVRAARVGEPAVWQRR